MAASKVPKASGFVKQGFERVRDVFSQSIESGVERGGSFAAFYRGELVVNLWGGYADEESGRPWKHNTASVFYSSTKSVAAIVMAHLVQKGLLSYEQPVSSYWPQFAQNGKEKISLKQVLSLTAGLSVLSSPMKLGLLRDDPDEVERRLAEQKPWKTAGESAAYSPIVIGLYLDCIVKKVDPKKRGLAQYFHEEIAEPFGIDLFIGMPKSEFWRATRSVVTLRGKEYKEFEQKMASNPAIDPEILLASASQTPDFKRNSFINNPEFMELPSPASHGVGSAAGMAKLHGILANGGSTVDGRCLLSEDMIQKLQTPLFIGKEKTFGNDFFYSYGTGLLPCLEGEQIHYSFGHGGFGGQYAAADPKYKTGWAYCTNYLDPTIMLAGKTKWNALEHALFQCVHNLEGVEVERRILYDYTVLLKALQKQKSKL